MVEGAAGAAQEHLATLYQTRYPHLVAHLRKMAKGRDSIQGIDLEDLVSQAFVACYHSLPTHPAQAYTYLRTTATRLFLDQVRRAQILTFTTDLPDSQLPDPTKDVDNRDLVSRALAPLLDRERDILLEWARGTHLKELAQSRGLTIKATKSLMFRARVKAKRVLQPECNR